MSQSWIIVDKTYGNAIMETYSPALVRRLRRERYEAIPVMEYLQDLNRRIASQR